MVQGFLSTDRLLSPTEVASLPNPSSIPPSSPLTCVGGNPEYQKLLSDNVVSNEDGPLVLPFTIHTNFRKELNTEFKPGRRSSREQLIALTNTERELAGAAVIPSDLHDFSSKVHSFLGFGNYSLF